MNIARTASIELQPDDEAFVTQKVDSGEYDSANDVVKAALAALQERDAAFEGLLRDEVLPIHDRLLANPNTGRPIDEVFQRLRLRHELRTKIG